MGDRVNIVVDDGGERVYLYGHWSGYDAPEIVRRALARQQRWSDPPYLARIVFCEMVGEKNWQTETGFGISTEPGDNEYPFLIIDVATQTIRLENDSRPSFEHCRIRGNPRSYSFDEFAGLPVASWATLDSGVEGS